MSGLLPNHQELIEASAISDEVAAERGYWTATAPKELERLFGATQRKLVPALVIPTYDVRGERVFCQLRPDDPRVVGGKCRKYELPHGTRMVVDVPPRVRPALGDPRAPIVITEGARKADAAVSAGLLAIDLVGVCSWRGRNRDGGLTALADWESIALNDRTVYLAFDSDAMVKREVHAALVRLRKFLVHRDADVRVIYLPSGDGGAKTGLDDFLATGHTRDDVLGLASDELRPLPGEGNGSGRTRPMPRDVDGNQLLAELRSFITGYMVLPSDEVADLLALWALHTWAFGAAFATPYLRIVSASPDSGKTLLLEILAAICRNGWHAVNPSTAVLYRKIDQQQPTLLLDEMDNYPIEDRRDALSVLNAGYKLGAVVDRCRDTGDLETFKCFSPKAYAGLDEKSLVSTLLSRSVTIRLERKTAAEKRKRWIAPLCEPEAARLRDRCAGWAHDHVDSVRERQPELPASLVNRAAEVWWAILAIAEEIGGEWPRFARQAASALSTGGDAIDEIPEQTRLLADIRRAFNREQSVFTKDLLEKLNGLEESPWGAKRRGEGLDSRGLSRMLRPFKIRPRTIGSGADSAKGYRFDQFVDAFARYLPDPSQASHPSHPATHGTGDATDATDATDISGSATRAEPTCLRPEHRASDWAFEAGEVWICGVCYPPASTAGIVYRNAGWAA
jgi:hypothetical protein